MTGLTHEQFLKGIELLAEAYPKGKQHAVFTNQTITSIWFRFFQNYSPARFKRVIEHYITNSSWFPNAPHEIERLWDQSGEQERIAQQQLAALPPAQPEDFTPEQLAENRRKIFLATKLVILAKGKGIKLPPLQNTSSHELEAIVKGISNNRRMPIESIDF